MRLLEIADKLLRTNVPGVTRVECAPSEIQIVASLPSARLAARVYAMTTMRIPELEGLLAKGVLEFNDLKKRGFLKGKDEPLIMISAPRAGAQAIKAAADFMKQYAPKSGWAVFDLVGTLRIVVPKLDIDITQSALPRTHVLPARTTGGHLFSDLNCWMLKILLLKDSPMRMWSGPRSTIRTPQELYQAAGVSRELAYRFVRLCEREDYLRATPSGFKIVRIQSLLESWVYDRKSSASNVIPVRWIMGQPKRLEDVFGRTKPSPRFAINGFAACRLLGVLHTKSTRVDIAVLRSAEGSGVAIKDFLKSWELETCNEQDAHFFLSEPRDNNSIFRGCVKNDEINVVDVLQAALEVSNHPARGREQAEYIFDHVLKLTDE